MRRRFSSIIKTAALVLTGILSLVVMLRLQSYIQIYEWRSPDKSSFAFPLLSCQRNVSAANVSGFSSLPGHIQDFLYYRHCRHFPMLLDVPDKCRAGNDSTKVFLLLVIKTSPENYGRREVVRKTWARERLHSGAQILRLFTLGTASSGFEKLRLNKLLELEHREYADVLQWDFKDSFFNLTLKQTLFSRWMEKNCPRTRFIFNGDDDTFANTDNMVDYLTGLPGNDGSKHLFVGHLIQHVGPVRESQSKYFVPVQVHESDSYPPYCGGAGYLLSGYTARVICEMSKSVRILPIDDVYMGMCLAKAGLQPASHTGFKTGGLIIPSQQVDVYDPCYYRDILLVHRLLPPQIYVMWHGVHDPLLKCGISRSLI